MEAMRAWFQRASRPARAALRSSPDVWTAFSLIALAACSLLASSYLPGWLTPLRVSSALIATGVAALLALAFAFAVTAAMRPAWPSRPTWRALARWAAIPLLAWALLSCARTLGALQSGFVASLRDAPPRYSSDEMYYNQYDAMLALRGENPYTDANTHMAQAMLYFHIQGYTPIARGEFAGRAHEPTATPMRGPLARYLAHPNSPPPEMAPDTLHSYPAGSFLLDAPFVWAGAPGMGAAQIVLYLALVVVIAQLAPGAARLPVLLLALCNPQFAGAVTRTDFDIWWIAALVGAWALSRRGWPATILVGVACAIKQTAWFFAPFYLIWIWRERGVREAVRQGGFALATFLVINAPWIMVSPAQWAKSLALPVTLPLFAQGSGLAGLMLAGALPRWPSAVFAALEVAAWLGAMAWFWRMCHRSPYVGLILPLLPLLFAWRSPARYFDSLTVLAVAALALTLRQADRARSDLGHDVERAAVAPATA